MRFQSAGHWLSTFSLLFSSESDPEFRACWFMETPVKCPARIRFWISFIQEELLDFYLDLPSDIFARGKGRWVCGICRSLICSWENHVRMFISFSNISNACSYMCECMYLLGTQSSGLLVSFFKQLSLQQAFNSLE